MGDALPYQINLLSPPWVITNQWETPLMGVGGGGEFEINFVDKMGEINKY